MLQVVKQHNNNEQLTNQARVKTKRKRIDSVAREGTLDPGCKINPGGVTAESIQIQQHSAPGNANDRAARGEAGEPFRHGCNRGGKRRGRSPTRLSGFESYARCEVLLLVKQSKRVTRRQLAKGPNGYLIRSRGNAPVPPLNTQQVE